MASVVFKAIWIGLAAVTLMASFSRLMPLCELTSHFRLYYAILLPFCFAAALLRRNNVAAIVIGLVSLINLQAILVLYDRPGMTQTLDFQLPIKVLEFNPCAYENREYQKFFDYVKKQKADLVVILELDKEWHQKLIKEMPGLGYPYKCISFHENCGMAVFSQLPYKQSKETIIKGTLVHPRLEVNFESPTEFTLVAVHASTPLYLNERNREFIDIANNARKTNCPIIVTGDLNCSPWSEEFMQIVRQGKLHNASQSFGPNCTWNARWFVPLIPIDHFLCGDQVKTTNVQVGDDLGSDHLPLVGEFELP